MPVADVSRAMPRFALVAIALAAIMLLPGGVAERTLAGSSGPVVNSADDTNDGACDAAHCSLREGLLAVDLGQTISFNIPGEGPHVIQPEDALPIIADDTITLDGYTQPGASPNTADPWDPGNAILQIVIDGSLINDVDVAGISVFGRGATVRGLVIQNFPGDGVFVSTAGSAAIRGNYIGTDVTGMQAAPNSESAVYIYSDQSGNVVGGGNPADRNLLSGNEDDGVEMIGGVSITVNGNFIGTNALGTGAIPNGKSGVDIRDGPETGIGGPAEGAGNLISGNAEHGVLLRGLGANRILVKNNLIGTAGDGTTPLPNAMHGIFLDQGAHDNTLGGVQPPNWNTIAYNGGAGVALSAAAGTDNYIDPNIIHSNTGLGIDLNADGVTPNDVDDVDNGPNDVQNFPVITRAEVVNGTLQIDGALNSETGHFYPLFFFANSECDPSGYGEGERYLGEEFADSVNGTSYEFEARFSSAVYDGEVITASASNPESTSEFSLCVEVEGAPPPPELEVAFADVDCMNGVNPVDSLKVLRADAGLANAQPLGCPAIGAEAQVNGQERTWGDIDCNLAMTPVDSLKILRFDAGLAVSQEAGCPGMDDLVGIVS